MFLYPQKLAEKTREFEISRPVVRIVYPYYPHMMLSSYSFAQIID
jgi:hypothetical protein